MPFVHFDSRYVPSGFLIVRDGANPYSGDDADSLCVSLDYDFPGIASRMGFVPCNCGATDGTVDCEHKSATDMISAAREWIEAREGESFPDLADYFPES